MDSKLAAAIAAVAATAVAVPALTSAQTPADTKFTKMTLTFTEKDSDDFGFVDDPPRTKFGKQGPQRLSIGDQLMFRTFLLNSANKRVGALDASCMVTGAGLGNGRFAQVNATCHGTVTVPGGQLFVAVGGKPFARSTTSGAVTGGTGAYDGATGSFTSVGTTNVTSTYSIVVPVR